MQDPTHMFWSPICVLLHSLVTLKPHICRSLWTTDWSFSEYSEGYLAKHTWWSYPDLKQSIDVQICLIMEKAWKLLTRFKEKAVGVCVWLLVGFFPMNIVYHIGKLYRNILALMSVLDYAWPIFRRHDQPVLPLKSGDVKCAPSQFLHR